MRYTSPLVPERVPVMVVTSPEIEAEVSLGSWKGGSDPLAK